MSSATKYDPRTGFHDVKPLVEPVSNDLLIIILAAAVLGLLVMLYRLRPKSQQVLKPRSAAEFLEQLRNLEKQVRGHAIDLRSAASVVSQTMREYLEVRQQCSALELTPKELSAELERSVTFPRSEISHVVDLVRGCERVSFADFETANDEKVQEYVRDAGKVIESLERTQMGTTAAGAL